jgi:hypothetical protein
MLVVALSSWVFLWLLIGPASNSKQHQRSTTVQSALSEQNNNGIKSKVGSTNDKGKAPRPTLQGIGQGQGASQGIALKAGLEDSANGTSGESGISDTYTPDSEQHAAKAASADEIPRQASASAGSSEEALPMVAHAVPVGLPWSSNGTCFPSPAVGINPLKIDGRITSLLCNPANSSMPCCSKTGHCGIGRDFCSCTDCVDSRVVLLKQQMASQCSDSLSKPLPKAAQTMAGTGLLAQDLDVVYNWVNSTSPAFQAQYKTAVEEHGKTHGVNWNSASTRDDMALRYSIRSLIKSGVWPRVRKVYIVFNPVHGPPTFLDPSHPQLVLVPQGVVLSPQGGAVPNFNSNALQLAVANLPGVLPWVLFLEDDTHLLTLDVGGDDGGGSSGCPSLAELHENAYFLYTLHDRGVTAHNAPKWDQWDPWFIYQNNSNTLIDSIFGPTEPAGLRGAELHAPHVLNMCVLEFMTHRWPAVEKAAVANMKRPLRDAAGGDQEFLFLYPQFLAAVGLAKQQGTGFNIAGTKHAELHLPSHPERPASDYHRTKQTAAQEISAVVEPPSSPCWINLQGYDKVEGDPVNSAVADFFDKHLGPTFASPLEVITSREERAEESLRPTLQGIGQGQGASQGSVLI